MLVDTGMTELHPAPADLDPRLRPLTEQDLDLAGIDIVVNTHLHADHCGSNHLFAGRPIPSSAGSSTPRGARTATPSASGSEGQMRVLALDPEPVWLAHEHEPWRPPAD